MSFIEIKDLVGSGKTNRIIQKVINEIAENPNLDTDTPRTVVFISYEDDIQSLTTRMCLAMLGRLGAADVTVDELEFDKSMSMVKHSLEMLGWNINFYCNDHEKHVSLMEINDSVQHVYKDKDTLGILVVDGLDHWKNVESSAQLAYTKLRLLAGEEDATMMVTTNILPQNEEHPEDSAVSA